MSVMKEIASPKACLIETPNKASILFGGRYINLVHIARSQGMDASYLSRIFRGERTPTIPHAQGIAAALGMSLQEFLDAIEDRKQAIAASNAAIAAQHYERLKREDKEDLDRIKKGQIAPPRVPGLRAS